MSEGLGDACPTTAADVVGILSELEVAPLEVAGVNWDTVLDSSRASELAREAVWSRLCVGREEDSSEVAWKKDVTCEAMFSARETTSVT